MKYELYYIDPLFKKVNLINHPTYKAENDFKKENIYNIFGWKIDNITIKKENYVNNFTRIPRNEEGYFLYINVSSEDKKNYEKFLTGMSQIFYCKVKEYYSFTTEDYEEIKNSISHPIFSYKYRIKSKPYIEFKFPY